MAWIQCKGGKWWKDAAWEGYDWTLKMDPVDGTLVFKIGVRGPVKRTLVKAGFGNVSFKMAADEPCGKREKVYHVTANEPFAIFGF